ncbi:MAG TPA: hypothetical protein DDZ80_14620 [Cyanobacteria bacterium UBA8803]|nr:hypothetical protein [Cyanobacteria bacterium UBA9273]HBL59667.1 hypothetical protein [Cyanobacteria bacterium UBA8803]
MSHNTRNWYSTKAGLLGSTVLLLGLLVPTSLSILPARAVEIGEGQTFFNRSPRLIRVAASNTSPTVPATYQFTIQVPEDAGEPLQAVKITQKENLEQISFDESQSRAFIGDSWASGSSIPLANIGGNAPADANDITVVFDQPVAPGNTVTVTLNTNSNPLLGGVYQFGVTAFSRGENSPGLYLGSGRIHFQSR